MFFKADPRVKTMGLTMSQTRLHNILLIMWGDLYLVWVS